MDLKKVFFENRYSRMSDIIGEGRMSPGSSGVEMVARGDVRGDDLVERKPQLHNPLLPPDYTGLKLLTNELIGKMEDRDDETGPKAEVIYQEVRSCGPMFNSATTQVRIGDVGDGIQDGEVCRTSKYYTSMRELGNHFYHTVPVRLRLFEEVTIKINYGMFTALDVDACAGLGCGEYTIDARIQILTDPKQQSGRRNALWSSTEIAPVRYFNSKCQDIISETSIKVEDIMTALGLARENVGLSSADIIKIRNYMQMGATGCATLRFTVMYLMLLRMWHGGLSKMELNTTALTHEGKDYTSKSISDCLSENHEGTVVNVINMEEVEVAIMLRSLFGYKCGDFTYQGNDFYMGGFDVPPEISGTGSAYLLGATKKCKSTLTITPDDIYSTMVKYAMARQGCEEMEMGFVLACSFIYADGLPNISVPRPQGYVDILMVALSKVNTDGFVPPYEIDEMAILGAMVTSRQQILMAHDVIMCSDSTIIEESVCVMKLPMSARQAIYRKYAKERFSDAFGVSSVTDPLLFRQQSQVDDVRNIPFPSVAWSAINNDIIVRGTLSEYFYRGYWVKPDTVATLDTETRNKVMTTYLANALLELPETRGIKVLRYGALLPTAYNLRMEPGKCCTKVLDFVYVHKIDTSATSNFASRAFDIEETEDLDNDVEFVGRGIDEPRSADMEMIKRCMGLANRIMAGEEATEDGGLDAVGVEEPVIRSGNQPAMELIVDSFNAITGKDRVPKNKDATIPTVRRKVVAPTPQSLAVEAVKHFLNTTTKCYEGSFLSRLSHVIGRICPESAGVICSLRTEIGLSSFDSNNTRMWQVCAKIIKTLAALAMTQAVITPHRMSKWLALCASVERYGKAKTRFYLTYLPSYDRNERLLLTWKKFLASFNIKVLYHGKELGELEHDASEETPNDDYHELMELTRNLHFPFWEELFRYWNYSSDNSMVNIPITAEELKKISVILNQRCDKCMY